MFYFCVNVRVKPRLIYIFASLVSEYLFKYNNLSFEIFFLKCPEPL